MLLKAPYILTDGGILKDHAILVEGEKIVRIAPQKDLPSEGEILELPGMILFPGLINAHCHLELSQLADPLPYPGSFVGWIEQLTRLKLQMSPEQTENSIREGIRQLVEGGTTTVADHMSVTTSPQTLMESALEGVVYVEVLGVEANRAKHFYEQAVEIQNPKSKIQNKSQIPNPRFQIIVTPHAPYSLLPEVFFQIIQTSNIEHRTSNLSIHIAESAEEYLLFRENGGPLAEFLASKGKTPPTIGETPVGYLKRLNLLPRRCLAIHANYLEEEDIITLQNFEASVVHCPGSHEYFGHDRFPLGLLQDAGITVALGTDSLASNNSLNMFEQMRRVLENYAELTPARAIQMATSEGAKALQRENEIGSLKAEKFANIVGVPFRSPKKSIKENIVLSDKAAFTMIRGILTPNFNAENASPP